MIHQLERSNYFGKVKEFMSSLILLTRGIISPNFLGKATVKKALSDLSNKIQETDGKRLASLKDGATFDFPVALLEHQGT